mmetsp:Transcript_38537/g.46581  ORF Transcript_38537/g.46581 Transcript_38537/m.46581 type:complete len:375 (+) Transcript_38537:413-1537(+)|eukprot:CAMPEP_0197845256 /NCGR_PEP_ID=MMETSP1438-20131217/2196_1 /TAXON_ID=1461541 /ORGANISM="Pterosperma sp., Strain CCMP1384" /LENGTH=374 /DNA_ID=CAMNT_0043456457 /DNA_START=404 /DNA_END=1528 /DNA_ORIENTATION=-
MEHPTESLIKSIHIYPVKSCQGLSVTSATLTPYGLDYDRRWAVVSNLPAPGAEGQGQIETQFDMNFALAKIQTFIYHNILSLRAPGMKTELQIPIRASPDPRRRVQVSAIQRTKLPYAEDEGPEASEWLTTFMRMQKPECTDTFHLVWCPPDASRSLKKDPRYGPLYTDSQVDEQTAFADTAQYHVASEASLQALNEHIQGLGNTPIGMSRFRPNIVIEGSELGAWDEDTWKVVQLGRHAKMHMRVCMPDLRCHVTSLVQEGAKAGTRDKVLQPIKSLRQMRKGVLRKGMVFGVKLNNLNPHSCDVYVDLNDAESAGFRYETRPVIRVGDSFQVLERMQKSMLQADLDELRHSLAVNKRSEETKVTHADLPARL